MQIPNELLERKLLPEMVIENNSVLNVVIVGEAKIEERTYNNKLVKKVVVPVITEKNKDQIFLLHLNKISTINVSERYGTETKNWVNKKVLVRNVIQLVQGKQTNVLIVSPAV